MIPHIINGNGTISLMIDGTMKPIDTAHKNYDEIKEALKNGDWEAIPHLVHIAEQVEEAINQSSSTGVTIQDGEVLYNGTPIHNTLTDRIVSMSKEGFDIGHMVKFLDNLMQNPSYRAVTELYDFLEAGNIPITENGTFLTYKKIREDWKDIYTGTIDNSIGVTVSMPRNQVNEDSNQTCSTGLHVCSYDYLPHFGTSNGDRVVICEIDPCDVVSIPSDYNNTKMRVCEYTVVGEVEDFRDENVLAQKSVITTDEVAEASPKPEVDAGRVDENTAKMFGKRLSSYLSSKESDVEGLIAIMLEKLPADIANHINDALNSNPKRAGKVLSKYMQDGWLSVDKVQDLFIAFEEFLDNVEKDIKCSRCGSTDVIDGECQDCGYYL